MQLELRKEMAPNLLRPGVTIEYQQQTDGGEVAWTRRLVVIQVVICIDGHEVIGLPPDRQIGRRRHVRYGLDEFAVVVRPATAWDLHRLLKPKLNPLEDGALELIFADGWYCRIEPAEDPAWPESAVQQLTITLPESLPVTSFDGRHVADVAEAIEQAKRLEDKVRAASPQQGEEDIWPEDLDPETGEPTTVE